MTLSARREQLLALAGQGPAVDKGVHDAVVRFAHMEARLLDDERLRAWADLLTDDLLYWAPLRENRLRRDKRPELDGARSALFDETKASILLRIGRLESGMAWAEDPPTRQVHVVGNVEAFHLPGADDLEVHSTFLLYRNRSERDDSTLVGRRRDILTPVGDSFRLRGRLILLQQATLLTKNLSSFF